MSNKFLGTRTEKNLEAAFAGESQESNASRFVLCACIRKDILRSVKRIIKGV